MINLPASIKARNRQQSLTYSQCASLNIFRSSADLYFQSRGAGILFITVLQVIRDHLVLALKIWSSNSNCMNTLVQYGQAVQPHVPTWNVGYVLHEHVSFVVPQ